ncbi:PREDICTED: UPF0725 protein At1g19060-like isoform X3 [Brassica oleracea var. oleracea]|uniref:UPF0725 protein At1g19060-like isoform X3 n=1 Tax=Brassica oleracea var. oleracea TaxID=109376 RepID=UPI0006A6A8CB|nr:PREDICTED: UPF0725 protein At1g19060-like isoform X3 [Brassica oleracea var. oleracea]
MVAFLSGYPRKEVDRLRRSYMKEVNKSEGFDVSGLPVPDSAPGLTEHICNDTCSPLILLYAKLGLHRYNLVQTRVNELRYGELVLECCTARPLGETHICGIKKSSDHKPVEDLLHTFPEWPPKNPFKKSKRCYVLKKSELRENDDWIRLYLELAVATTNRNTLENHLVSNLKIVKVAIDTTSTQEGLDLFAIVYIRYKDSCEARVGKDVDRVAVVRRFFNEGMGSFSLVGQNLGIIQKKSNKQLLRFKPWLLYTPRWRLKAYRHSGLTLSRRVPKTRSMEFFLSQFTFRDDFTKKGKESECETVL